MASTYINMPLRPGSVLASHFSCSALQWLQWAEFWEFVQKLFFFYKNINDSLSKGEPVCDGHLHVPRAQGGRCPAIWVGSISIFQQHYEKYTICFRFHPSLLKMGSCCCDHRSECISNNWFCLRCPTSTGRVVPNRNQVYEISSDISVYIIIYQTWKVIKNAPPLCIQNNWEN